MIRALITLGACVTLLAGCSTPPRPDAFPARYTLTPAPLAVPAATPAPATTTLRLDRIAAPAWLQGTAMLYRLDYRNPDVIAAYADSEWAAPPAALLVQLVRTTLAASGGWGAVIGPATAAPADFRLSIRMDDFSQAFSAPGQSRGVLDATATLTADPDGRVMAQRRFRIGVPARRANAAGGAAALGRASRQFAAELEAWLRAGMARSGARAATLPHP